ncbi:MAG TPA: TAXI family TRAP transporter solute-binding subunit [Motiliproteus sp.]
MSATTHPHRETWILYGLATLLVIAGFVIAYQFVQPAPPHHIRIATGSSANAYYRFAEQYARQLAADGITLEVIETQGSVANLALLNSHQAEIALVQGGVADATNPTHLTALGSLYFEPLWVFVRADLNGDRLLALKGKRLAIGSEGSGTRAISLQLLGENGIDSGNSQLLPLAGDAAQAALLDGEIDALFMVTSPTSPRLRKLLLTPGIQPLNFARADAYARRFSHLSALDLPEGAIDLALNIPARPLRLIAPAATLVANGEFHPALTTLMLQAASRVHGDQGLFENRGQFPSPELVDLPLNEDAARFYKSGAPLLQRFMPFWAANLVDRLIVMLLPLITLMIPLMKILPPTSRWRVRSRIYRWYDQLRDLDFRTSAANSPAQIHQLLSELEHIEQDVMQVTVPKSYADAQYNLRLHLRLIRERLDRQAQRHQ